MKKGWAKKYECREYEAVAVPHYVRLFGGHYLKYRVKKICDINSYSA